MGPLAAVIELPKLKGIAPGKPAPGKPAPDAVAMFLLDVCDSCMA
jgi:hypothetical protein